MESVYERAIGGYSYEILDGVAYDRYWWGKKPSTREAFEIWLKDPTATQVDVARMYGRDPTSIFHHVTKLRREGILRKFKRGDI